jgi:hypothetical protein
MKGPAESGQICSVGRRKIANKIAKNKRCYANTLRPCSRMLLKVSTRPARVQAGAVKVPGLFEVPRHSGVRSLLASCKPRRTPSASKSLV